MFEFFLKEINQVFVVFVRLIVGFSWFWVGQLTYQKLFRPMNLNLQLFVNDNAAVAIALVGYYLGMVLALGSILEKIFISWSNELLVLGIYGILVLALMLVGAWLGNRFILRRFDCTREILEERNIGAATTEAGVHIANGLILNTALGGNSGNWKVGLIAWIVGMNVLILASFLYPQAAKYDVFEEIEKRNNPATGIAFAGFLVAVGNSIRTAFYPEFQGWLISFTQYGMTLVVCLAALIFIRWFADLILVPGVKISDEIVRQDIPNLGAGAIEAFSYIAASFLIQWTF